MRKKPVAVIVGMVVLVASGFIGANVYASLCPPCEPGEKMDVMYYTNPSFSLVVCERELHLTPRGRMH
jgi:hypothetical protein